MSDDELKQTAMYIVFQSEIGSHTGYAYVDLAVFQQFIEAVRQTHIDIPYHTFAQAVDVLGASFRLLTLQRWDSWLAPLDATCLLISALCSNIAHPG